MGQDIKGLSLPIQDLITWRVAKYQMRAYLVLHAPQM